jgi:hypothetical protein
MIATWMSYRPGSAAQTGHDESVVGTGGLFRKNQGARWPLS